MVKVGLDVGSTTIKCVVLDDADRILYSTYERHYSHILEKSEELLRRVAALLAEGGWTVGNIDATLLAQTPKVGPFRREMEANLAAALGIGTDQVNVKATTEEGLGFTGDSSGMAAHAVALLERNRQTG